MVITAACLQVRVCLTSLKFQTQLPGWFLQCQAVDWQIRWRSHISAKRMWWLLADTVTLSSFQQVCNFLSNKSFCCWETFREQTFAACCNCCNIHIRKICQNSFFIGTVILVMFTKLVKIWYDIEIKTFKLWSEHLHLNWHNNQSKNLLIARLCANYC